MNQEELMKILPHRRSMLLVEEATVEDGKAHGKYHVRGDEWFLDGHFDDNPVVPGVILCEMLAQSACAAGRRLSQGYHSVFHQHGQSAV